MGVDFVMNMNTQMYLGILLFAFIVDFCRGANHSESEGGHFPEYLRNCTGYTDNQLRALNATTTVSAFVSLVVVSFILVAAWKHKAKRNLLDRLFLYLIAVTAVLLFIVFLNIIHQIQYFGDGNACKLLGFFTIHFIALSFILNVVIAISLLGTPYRYLIRKRPVQGEMKGIEATFFVFVTIFPLSSSLIPFFNGGYGYNFALCWVRSVDESCTFVKYKSLVIIYSNAGVQDAINILLAVVMAVIYCVYGYWKFHNPQVAVLLRKSIILMAFIFTRGVALLFIGLIPGYRFLNDTYAYIEVYATIAMPCIFLPLPLGYVIYLYTSFNPNRSCHCSCISARRRNNEAQPHDYVLANDGIPLAATMLASVPSYTQSLLPPDTGIGAATGIPADENSSPRDQAHQARETDNDDDDDDDDDDDGGDRLFSFSNCCCFTAQHGTETPMATASNNPVSVPSYTAPLPLEHTGIASVTDADAQP